MPCPGDRDFDVTQGRQQVPAVRPVPAILLSTTEGFLEPGADPVIHLFLETAPETFPTRLLQVSPALGVMVHQPLDQSARLTHTLDRRKRRHGVTFSHGS